MAEKGAKKKGKGGGKKAAQATPSVLGALPSTRPNRLARRRDGDAGAPAEQPVEATAKPRAPAAGTAAAGTGTTRGKATATKAAKTAAATTKPRAKAGSVAGASAEAAAKPRAAKAAKPKAAKPRASAPEPEVVAAADSPGPTPVSAGAPPLRDRPAPTPPPPRRRSAPPQGTELVTTAIQAAGEIAQIGLTVGGQVLKRAVDRLPRP